MNTALNVPSSQFRHGLATSYEAMTAVTQNSEPELFQDRMRDGFGYLMRAIFAILLATIVLASCAEECGIPGTVYGQCAYRYSDDLTPISVTLQNKPSDPPLVVPPFSLPRAYISLADGVADRAPLPKELKTNLLGMLVSVSDFSPIKIARKRDPKVAHTMITLSPIRSGLSRRYTSDGSICKMIEGDPVALFSGSDTYKERKVCNGSEHFYAGSGSWPRVISCIFHERMKPTKCTLRMGIAENIDADVSVPHPRLSGSLDESDRIGLSALKKICTFIPCAFTP